MVPLMLFVWTLETKTELTETEVRAGIGKRLLLSMEFHQQQLEGGLWHKKRGLNWPLGNRLSTELLVYK